MQPPALLPPLCNPLYRPESATNAERLPTLHKLRLSPLTHTLHRRTWSCLATATAAGRSADPMPSHSICSLLRHVSPLSLPVPHHSNLNKHMHTQMCVILCGRRVTYAASWPAPDLDPGDISRITNHRYMNVRQNRASPPPSGVIMESWAIINLCTASPLPTARPWPLSALVVTWLASSAVWSIAASQSAT